MSACRSNTLALGCAQTHTFVQLWTFLSLQSNPNLHPKIDLTTSPAVSLTQPELQAPILLVPYRIVWLVKSAPWSAEGR